MNPATAAAFEGMMQQKQVSQSLPFPLSLATDKPTPPHSEDKPV